ncbi:ras-related protein Rab-26 isoform X4 [Pseudorca crassidens]|uniref:ras-related protein Rab-26 isoform X4 n=1 Tax=Pseudorca crassidens TaxID=82174 RepID=UPI00352C0FF9
MSRKKTPKSKGGRAPATSALPATHGSQPVRPGTARPGPEAPPNRPPQPGRSSLGGGGDFYDVAFKVMLVGDSGVGKTCLLVRFKDGAFLAGTFISTVGIDFRIWDTAGQERFRSVTHAYYRDAHALLLLYDVTNKASFNSIQAWLTEIQEYAQHDVVLMLLGNKVDSAQERVVKREDGEKLAKVSCGWVGSQSAPGAAGPELSPPGCQRLFAGVRAAVHGDQRQDGPQCGLGFHGHSKPSRASAPTNRLQEARGSAALLHLLLRAVPPRPSQKSNQLLHRRATQQRIDCQAPGPPDHGARAPCTVPEHLESHVCSCTSCPGRIPAHTWGRGLHHKSYQGPELPATSPPTRRPWFKHQQGLSCYPGGCQGCGFVMQ